jgi:beta-phosphoglucomutase-like phosphatase (HAD superfamily)
VRLFGAWDGSEAFRDAALALDRELNLLDGSGARLVFIASDGVFVDDKHRAYAQTWVPLAQRRGVGVFFLDFTRSMGFGTYGATKIDCKGKTAAEVAQIVGRAAIKEMRRIDRRV